MGKDAQLQLRAGEHEEQHQQRRRPLVRAGHDLLGQGAEVAEDAAQHHAHQQGGKAQLRRPQGDGELGQGHGQEHKADGHGQTVGVGMEELFQLRQAPAGDGAQDQRGQDLQDGIDHNGIDVHDPAAQRLGNTEGNGEKHQAHRVVQSDDGQQQIGQGALGLVLAHDHQRGGRRGGGGDGAEGDGRGQGQHIRPQEMEDHQGDVHAAGGDHGLENADHQGLLAGLPQLGEAEFVADGEGDEAQGHIGDQAQAVQLLIAGKAEAGHAQRAHKTGADQKTGDQIRRHIRQMPAVHHAGHHESGKHGDGQRQQFSHILSLLKQPCYCTAGKGEYQAPKRPKKRAFFRRLSGRLQQHRLYPIGGNDTIALLLQGRTQA